MQCICGAEVPPKPVGELGRAKIYCSVKCRNRAATKRARGKMARWDRADRQCEHCGASFSPRTEQHIYCSPKCRSKAENLKRFGGSGSNSNYYRTAFIEERGGRCERCGVPDDLELHHIVTVAAGGSHKAANLLLVCKACHGNEHKLTKHHPDELVRATMAPTAEDFSKMPPAPVEPYVRRHAPTCSCGVCKPHK